MTDEASNEPVLVVDRRHAVPLRELSWTFSASGGPGGQHANTANTRAEVRLDLTKSTAFSDSERARLIERLGEVVRVVAVDERSQWRNRELALERLAERLARALHRAPPRVATKRTRGSNERRLTGKRQRSATKATRRQPPGDD